MSIVQGLSRRSKSEFHSPTEIPHSCLASCWGRTFAFKLSPSPILNQSKAIKLSIIGTSLVRIMCTTFHIDVYLPTLLEDKIRASRCLGNQPYRFGLWSIRDKCARSSTKPSVAPGHRRLAQATQ